jgi:hypothetical protein
VHLGFIDSEAEERQRDFAKRVADIQAEEERRLERKKA